MDMNPYLIFTFVTSIVYFAFSLLLVKIIGKKYDKILTEKKLPWPISASSFISPSSWGRANLYSCYIFRNPSAKIGYGTLLNGFKFRNYASKLDIIISLIHIVLMIIFFMSLIFSFIV